MNCDLTTILDHAKLLDHISDGVYLCDRDRRIVYWNQAARNLTGYSLEQISGKSCCDGLLCHTNLDGESLCSLACPMQATLADGMDRSADVYLQHRDGHRVPVNVRTTALKDAQGNIVGVAQIFHDLVHRVSAGQRLKEFHTPEYLDPLTGVATRQLGQIVLTRRLQHAQSDNRKLGVLMVDADCLEEINDRYGASVGDRMLQIIAANLLANVRGMDVVSRWSGEEFLVVLDSVTPTEMAQISRRLCTTVEGSHFLVENQPVGVTISIGGALAQPQDDVSHLLIRADQMLMTSKSQGRNCVTLAA